MRQGVLRRAAAVLTLPLAWLLLLCHQVRRRHLLCILETDAVLCCECGVGRHKRTLGVFRAAGVRVGRRRRGRGDEGNHGEATERT